MGEIALGEISPLVDLTPWVVMEKPESQQSLKALEKLGTVGAWQSPEHSEQWLERNQLQKR